MALTPNSSPPENSPQGGSGPNPSRRGSGREQKDVACPTLLGYLPPPTSTKISSRGASPNHLGDVTQVSSHGSSPQRLRVAQSPSAPRKDVTRESCASHNSETGRQAKAHATRAGFKRPAFWVMSFGWSLAASAGFVNAVAYRTFHLYVSHATGTTTAIGMRIEGYQQGKHEFDTLREAVSLLVSFLFGAFLCGLLIDKNQVHFLGKAFYGIALVGNAALLVAATFIEDTLVAACFASAACGLQNAMCTSHFGAIVRTTHVTGTVTDIGSTLGRITMIFMRKGCRRSRFNVLERAEVGVDARKLLVLGPMWFSYLLGTIAGAYVEDLMLGTRAFLVPAAFSFSVGVGYMTFRQTLKDYIKGLERARLNADLHLAHKALAHTASRLHDLPPSRQNSAEDGDLVIELDEKIGHMMEALEEVEQDVENLCASSGPSPFQGARCLSMSSGK